MSKNTALSAHPPLVLASGSPYRKQLLDRLGLHYTHVSPDIDEQLLEGERPAAGALRLSGLKAGAVASTLDEGLVIGSDQIACLQGHIRGKPGDFATAREQLREASGQWVEFYTGLALTCASSGVTLEALAETRVLFRQLSVEEIDRYLIHDRPLDCAGSFKSEGFGISLIERIEGHDPTALIGLSLIDLVRLLRQWGLNLP